MLRAAAKGLTNAEIAAQLFVTETTVKTYMTRLLDKLDVRRRIEAIVLAYEWGVVSGNGSS